MPATKGSSVNRSSTPDGKPRFPTTIGSANVIRNSCTISGVPRKNEV